MIHACAGAARYSKEVECCMVLIRKFYQQCGTLASSARTLMPGLVSSAAELSCQSPMIELIWRDNSDRNPQGRSNNSMLCFPTLGILFLLHGAVEVLKGGETDKRALAQPQPPDPTERLNPVPPQATTSEDKHLSTMGDVDEGLDRRSELIAQPSQARRQTTERPDIVDDAAGLWLQTLAEGEGRANQHDEGGEEVREDPAKGPIVVDDDIAEVELLETMLMHGDEFLAAFHQRLHRRIERDDVSPKRRVQDHVLRRDVFQARLDGAARRHVAVVLQVETQG